MISYLLALILERQTACLYWVHHDGNIITFQLLDSGPDPMFLFSLVTFSYWSKVKCYASFNQLRLRHCESENIWFFEWKYFAAGVKIFWWHVAARLQTSGSSWIRQSCYAMESRSWNFQVFNARVKVNGPIERWDDLNQIFQNYKWAKGNKHLNDWLIRQKQ